MFLIYCKDLKSEITFLSVTIDFRRLGVRPERPIIPIALGRSRRHVAKVDYNFGAYDELIRVNIF